MEASKKIDQIWFWKWDELRHATLQEIRKLNLGKIDKLILFPNMLSIWKLGPVDWLLLTIDWCPYSWQCPATWAGGRRQKLLSQLICPIYCNVTILSDSVEWQSDNLIIWHVCQCRLTVSCDNLTRVPCELMLNIWQLFQMSARRYKMETKVRVTCFGILFICSKNAPSLKFSISSTLLSIIAKINMINKTSRMLLKDGKQAGGGSVLARLMLLVTFAFSSNSKFRFRF